MPDDKPKAGPPEGEAGEARAARSGGGGMFWLGILTGLLITVVVFCRPVLEIFRDAFVNVLPLVFSPGLLEISVAIVGLGIVITVNHLLRKEREDEWVEIPDDED